MPSTYLSLHCHIVFATKERRPFIARDWRPRLHEYLGGVVAGLTAFPQGVGGVEDHVHLLVGLRATHCVADLLRELKKASSTWIREQIGVREFAWQEGYSAFSVSATARDGVKRYIDAQEEHHRTRTFREELIEMFEAAGVAFDPEQLP